MKIKIVSSLRSSQYESDPVHELYSFRKGKIDLSNPKFHYFIYVCNKLSKRFNTDALRR